MTILDILIGLPLVYAIYKGFTKGLIVEVATLLALILGIYGAIHFSDFTAEFINKRFEYDSNYMGIMAFVITFIVIVIVLNVLGKMLNSLIEAVALGMVNRLLGAMFGLLKGIIILSIVIYFVNILDKKFHFISQEKKNNSFFYQPLIIISETMFDILDSDLGDAASKVKEEVQKQLPVEV
ncbi:CvpA family protein [Marinifilum sp.]|uniref:CvpA family protein n=1 Tax=Marinifilum sp. TaxID=2033137 RepID=UPI003BA8F17B